ncbi:MAG: HAMP domain-containing histidine kinase [Scytonematopsis contorta HA4267-MV1]|nr:HAMP domain-containing histidine kinase [Scytonematopsis contorta HA4267-MV1]
MITYNSRPSSKKNLVTKTISITTNFSDNKDITIRIADNGCGIPDEVKPKIFDPFFTTKPVGSGTGLGLSISYKIVVEQHGGDIFCISQPGQGTEFWIEIPVSVVRQIKPVASAIAV